MISSQCPRRHTSVSSLVLVIMIVAKFLLIFSPLLLLANAQSGGRLGFFSRPDFRRPRPWERPTVAPVPDTPMPTEKVTERITDSPRASTELPTITPVRPTSGPPVSSVPSSSQRGRVWARPVFQGSRPIATYTPAAITPAVSIASSTKKPEVYVITPSSIIDPFVDNHAQYKDPNNFNSRGRYVPKITHNNDEIPSDSTKTSTRLPLTTEKITEFTTEQTTIPTESHSPMVSSTSTTTESVTYTMAPTTAIPFINNPTTKLKMTPEPLTTPSVTFIPTRVSNFDSSTHLPLYVSHNNVPTPGNQPQYTPGDYLKPSPTTVAATELPSSTTESAGYKIPSSPKVPFVDDHKRYNDIYSTTKTPIPFKIVSASEVPSASTSRPIYQVNQKDETNIAKDSELHLTTTPKAVTMPITEPEVHIITPTTKTPIIDEHKFDNGFSSHLSVEYANGYEKSSEEQSKSDGYNNPLYPVYHHEIEKVSHYEQSSVSTRKPEGYTVATSKIPFIDSHKLYEAGYTSGPAIEYTNGHDKTTETPTSKIPIDDPQKFIQNIYPNYNHKENDYEHLTPKVVTTTQSTYQYQPPKTTTEKPVVTQTVRHTNSYRYSDVTTKPTARYTTTTVRTSRLSNVYDIENFKCKDQDAYYSITNQCDDFIECKSGYPIQNTCPDGLHFNPAVKYGEFPCAFPSEVKCDINSVVRQPEPTSNCPRRYGYFSMQDGRCDKYIMCQEGLATIMSCPAGLAFSEATSSCDWPSNVPNCLPDAFQGFTCPAPELNEDGEPTQSIYKYRYDKSCKKYIACQKGHPRLLSCDSGFAFDENSESCIDEYEVTNCT